MASPKNTSSAPLPDTDLPSPPFAGAVVALAALAFIALLAFSGASRPELSDKIALLFLAITATVCIVTPLRAFFDSRADAATFALIAAFFVIYGIARHAGPEEGTSFTLLRWTKFKMHWPSLHLALLPESPIAIPWAAYISVIGALLVLVLARRAPSPPARALLAAVAVVGAIGIGIFRFLGSYYPVGATEVVNPEPLVYALMQIIEFGAVAILCSAVASHTTTRRLALRALPILLFTLWARHQFGPAPVEEDD